MYDNALDQETDWTGGGLNAPQDVKDQKAGDCGIVLEADRPTAASTTPDGFKPNSGFFDCDPKNVLTLHGDYSKYGKGVTLSDVGKTLDDLK